MRAPRIPPGLKCPLWVLHPAHIHTHLSEQFLFITFSVTAQRERERDTIYLNKKLQLKLIIPKIKVVVHTTSRAKKGDAQYFDLNYTHTGSFFFFFSFFPHRETDWALIYGWFIFPAEKLKQKNNRASLFQMKSPDPISEWSQDEIGNWLRGLDAGLDKYKEWLFYNFWNFWLI